MANPWLDLALDDYEGHMAWPGIDQAQLLASEFAALLARRLPESVAVVGCAGGNGFDRILRPRTTRVIGIDINPDYVAATAARYRDKLPGLELYVADIQALDASIEPVDLVYASLIFEYVELEPTLTALRALCRVRGTLAAIVQLPSERAVAPSPFASVQALARAMRLVSPHVLRAEALRLGLACMATR